MFRYSSSGENSTFNSSPHKLVVAEKPSVTREIAKVIGANESIDGALYGNGYVVSNALGHLVQLKEPDDYDEKYKKWALPDLPIIPNFEFKANAETTEQLDKLKALMNSDEIDSIICATDADREGECIFRYIYEYVGCKKPFERLWIASLTAESIQQGFADLKPSSEYDKMYEAGFSRNKVDWLFGMNLTRLYSVYSGVTCSIGRVQTAVVNMIVQRDTEIANFVKKPFFKLKLENGAEWFTEDEDSFSDRQKAEAVKAKCEHQICTVKSAETVLKKENRPLLFSLTSLQSEANEKLGMSAAATLVVMQSLYEKKLLTYPRTDSNYITDDMAAEMTERVKMLRFFDETAVDNLLLDGLLFDSRVVNAKKVGGHHAIIPTENIEDLDKAELSKDEKDILNMVITRFLAVFSKEYQYNETEYIFEVNGETFKCKTKTPVQIGWKKFYTENTDEEKEESKLLSVSYTQGETFEAKNLEITESETKPPKAYTEASLLRAMENIDRRIEDKELSEYVAKRGLGTPATRAKTIERIIAVGYVTRKGKSLISTDKGKKVINMLPEDAKNIEMTAQMEQQLAAIENGEVSSEEVIAQTIEKVKRIIENEKTREHVSLAQPRESYGKCPKCGGAVYGGKLKNGSVIYYCENSSQQKENPCIFRIFADDLFWKSKKKTLGVKTLQTLLSKGKVKVTGFYSEKKGTTYDAVISFGDDWEGKDGKLHIGFKMEFDNTQKSKKGGK